MTTQNIIDQWKLKTTFHSDHVVHHTVGTTGEAINTKWTEVRKIGDGGFGSVDLEKGVISGFERVRAVKKISRHFYSQNKKGLSRELHALIAVRDRQEFVQFFGWYEDKHAFYIAMEYLHLGDLGQYFKRSGEEAKLHVQDITLQLLEALTVLHGKKICHRDLKPPNVLIASLSPIRIKLADFGTSKFAIGTILKTRCGTPGYTAPEILGLFRLRGEAYTYAIDMWALGCLVHQILTSEVPFVQKWAHECSTSLDRMTGIETEVPSAVTDIQLLSKFCSEDVGLPTVALEESSVDYMGIDFIRKLLVANPTLRISAVDALSHIWLIEHKLLTSLSMSQYSTSDMINAQLLSLGIRSNPMIASAFVMKCTQDHKLDVTTMLPPSITGNFGYSLPEAAKRGYSLLLAMLLGPRSSSICKEMINANFYGWSLLQSAAKGGHLDTVKILLNRGAYIDLESEATSGRTALQAAAEFGHIDVVKFLLESGADINVKPAQLGGRTALQAAACNGQFEVVELLLANKAEVNAMPSILDGRTALQGAAENGNSAIVYSLLRSGAIITYGCKTPLELAIQGGHSEVVILLLNWSADDSTRPYWLSDQTALQIASILIPKLTDFLFRAWVDIKPSSAPFLRRTVLQAAAGNGYLEFVKFLISRSVDINTRPHEFAGRTALQAAAENGHIDIVQLLLENSADVNATPCRSAGCTALQAAAGNGHIDIVQLLLRYSADVNASPSKFAGLTALQAAAENGHIDIVRLLLRYSADVNASPSNFAGLTALQAAAENGHIDIVRLLLRYSADVNASPCYKNGWTALQIAAARGHLHVVKLLLDCLANINASPCETWGKTALQAAAENGHIDVVHLLLSHREPAEINASPCEYGGKTALQAAAGCGNLGIIKLFLYLLADVNASPCRYYGRTALQEAAENGYLDVVKLLLRHSANPNAHPCDYWGQTAFQAAANNGHQEVAMLLIANGADANYKKQEETTSKVVETSRHPKIAEILLESCRSGGLEELEELEELEGLEGLEGLDVEIEEWMEWVYQWTPKSEWTRLRLEKPHKNPYALQ